MESNSAEETASTSQGSSTGVKGAADLTLSWRRVTSPFPGRDGHCAASVDGRLYVFGGVVQVQIDEHHESNELLSFEPESLKWDTVSASGEQPLPRSSATMVSVGTRLYVFGGLSNSSGWLSDMFSFDTETKVWSKLTTAGTAPSPRDKIASAVIGNKIFIFGGFGPKTSEDNEDDSSEESDEDVDSLEQSQEAAKFGWFDDLYVFDTVTSTWSQPMHKNTGAPSPRAALTMCAVDKTLILFGGRDAQSRQNDLFIYDTITQKWLKDCTEVGSAAPPQPRSFHAACSVGSKVIVVGGRGRNDQHFDDIQVFDTVERWWLPRLIDVGGDKLTPRGVHTMTLVGEDIVVYAGSSDFDRDIQQCTRYHSDVFIANCHDYLHREEKTEKSGKRSASPTPSSSKESHEHSTKKQKIDDDFSREISQSLVPSHQQQIVKDHHL